MANYEKLFLLSLFNLRLFYIDLCVCMHAFVCIFMCALPVCIYVCACVCACVHMCVCVWVFMCLYVCVFVCFHVFVCMYVFVCFHVFVCRGQLAEIGFITWVLRILETELSWSGLHTSVLPC